MSNTIITQKSPKKTNVVILNPCNRTKHPATVGPIKFPNENDDNQNPLEHKEIIFF